MKLFANFKFLNSIALGTALTATAHAGSVKLLNVSYDPTRALYED